MALVALAACGSVLPATYSAEDLPDLTELDQTWGCGEGFWISDRDQTVGLRIAYQGTDLDSDRMVSLPHPSWNATLVVGSDLFANWCDDVVEPDEPTPIEHWNLEIVGGSLEVIGTQPAPFQGGELKLEATDLKVELEDSTVTDLGSVTIVNPTWGFFAG